MAERVGPAFQMGNVPRCGGLLHNHAEQGLYEAFVTAWPGIMPQN
jgi:hypothetical protein